MFTSKEKLIQLYSNTSKHSNYQILPSKIQKILAQDEIKTKTRLEAERLQYILTKVDVRKKKVLDIGANTGFFTFELLDAGAESVHYFEGNREHATFVSLAVEALNMGDKIQITNEYYTFNNYNESRYDIGLLLNVLHHVGDDYGDKSTSIKKAKELIIRQLNDMIQNVDTIIFQLGFNWQGDPTKPLFNHGTKKEMIEFLECGIDDYWRIESIGIAECINGRVVYSDINHSNIERDDSLGEFLNRPIFLLKSKRGLHI